MALLKNYKFLSFLFLSIIIVSCSDDSPDDRPLFGYEVIDRVYDDIPLYDECYAGEVKKSIKLKVLDRVNYFRDLHGLPRVTYNYNNDNYVQQGSYVLCKNNAWTHTPAQSLKCWSQTAYDGCLNSNLHKSNAGHIMDWKSEMAVDGWLSEEFSPSLGHRRWLLNPFLSTVSYGRADKIVDSSDHYIYSALYIVDTDPSTTAEEGIIACPYHDYPVTAFKDTLYLSAAILCDADQFVNNDQVDYSACQIIVEDSSGQQLSVFGIQYEATLSSYAGMPNHIEWRVNGLQHNEKYTVKLRNVVVNDEAQDYEYWFKIID